MWGEPGQLQCLRSGVGEPGNEAGVCTLLEYGEPGNEASVCTLLEYVLCRY